MTERKRDAKAILRTVARSELRSPLFHWMVKHHDELVGQSERERIDWSSFCAEIARRGITDTRGRPPTVEMARKTWTRVRKSVEKGKAEAKPPRPKPPSRFPADWTPTVLREEQIPVPAYLRPARAEVPAYLRPPQSLPALAPAQAVMAPTTQPEPVAEPVPGSDEYVEQQIASAMDQLHGVDWYLDPTGKRRRR